MLRTGQTVKYNGKETHIEQINKNGAIIIKNPDWDWDLEAEFTRDGLEYNVPYWITVNKNQIEEIKP